MKHGTSTPLPDVDLVRLDEATDRVRELRHAVQCHRIAPGQRRFVRSAAQTLPETDRDPRRVPFAVVHRDRAVGFGILDWGGRLREVTDAAADAVLLRGFYIDLGWQGRGLGRAACRELPRLVREVVPAARSVLLTVNEDNHTAQHTYRASGFADTGRTHLLGVAGPQRVFVRAELPR